MTARACLRRLEVRCLVQLQLGQFADIQTGFYRGIKDVHEDKSDRGDINPHVPDANGQIYCAVSQRTDDESPYTAYKPANQLDGRPISELADTSPQSPLKPAFQAANTVDLPSPIPESLRIRNSGPGRDYPRNKHAMSWNNYDAREAISPPSTLSSSISPTSGKHKVSPELATDFWTR